MDIISPLFAIEVEELLNSKNYLSAAELCRKGLKEYPDYNAAKKLLAVALKHIGQDEEAHDIINSITSYAKTTKHLKNTFTIEVENILIEPLEEISNDITYPENDNEDFNIDDLIANLQEDEVEKQEEAPSVEEVIAQDNSEDEDFNIDDLIANLQEDEVEKQEEAPNVEQVIDDNSGDDDFNIEDLIANFNDDEAEKQEINPNVEEVIAQDNSDDDDFNIDDLIANFNDDEAEKQEVVPFDEIVANKEQENHIKLISKLFELNKLTRYNTEYDILETVPGMNFIFSPSSILMELPDVKEEISLIDELDEIAKGLINQSSHISAFDEENEDDDFQHRTEMVTETLAKIYTTQGAYQAAIDIYKKLMLKEPEKVEKYQKKIKKLKNMLK